MKANKLKDERRICENAECIKYSNKINKNAIIIKTQNINSRVLQKTRHQIILTFYNDKQNIYNFILLISYYLIYCIHKN